MAEYEDHNLVIGNSIDFSVDNQTCESEIRADVIVAQSKAIRLWGMVKDCEGRGIANALINLVKVIHKNNIPYYAGVAHTVSDYRGFYQFDLTANDKKVCYKVLVGKASTGNEKVIRSNYGCRNRNDDEGLDIHEEAGGCIYDPYGLDGDCSDCCPYCNSNNGFSEERD